MKKTPTTYAISSAVLKSVTEQGLLVTISASLPILYGLMGVIFLTISVFLSTIEGGGGILIGLIALSLALVMASQTMRLNLQFDFDTRAINFVAGSWFGLRKTEKNFTMDQVVSIGQVKANAFGNLLAQIGFEDGSQLNLGFSKKADQAQLLQILTTKAEAGFFPALNSPLQAASAEISGTKALMARELRSWQVWLFIIAIGQMFAAGGFSPWGGLLIAMALVSMYFAEAGMFAIFAVTIAWAGISNLFSGNSVWTGMAIGQFFISFQIFQQFRRFLQIEKTENAQSASRSARVFPWAALVLGIGSLLGFLLMVVGIFANAFTVKSDAIYAALDWIETISVYAALIGLSTGLAGWIGSYPRKWASVVGVIVSGLTLLLQLGFMILVRLA